MIIIIISSYVNLALLIAFPLSNMLFIKERLKRGNICENQRENEIWSNWMSDRGNANLRKENRFLRDVPK